MTNTDNKQFTPRVVGAVPPTKRGAALKSDYSELFDMVWNSRPDAVLVAENVPPHHSVVIREALALRLDRPENEHIKAEGSFLVQTRVSNGGAGLVDVYVTFVPADGR